MLKSHIIITPTSNGKNSEIFIPRVGTRKAEVRSLTKLDVSECNRTGKMESALNSPTWDVRSFVKQPNRKKIFNDSILRLDESASEELKPQMNTGKLDNSMAQAFMNECETLEDVVSNLLKEINEDKSKSEKVKQEK